MVRLCGNILPETCLDPPGISSHRGGSGGFTGSGCRAFCRDVALLFMPASQRESSSANSTVSENR